MSKRLWLSVVMLAAGASLLVAASFANAAGPTSLKAKRGGTLHLQKSVEVDYVDPHLAYFAEEWSLENYTCARLMQYPDVAGPRGLRLVPEVAARAPRVSRNGKTYTFTIRKGFRYNTGRRVKADDFRWSIERMASASQQSATYSYHRDIVGYTDDYDYKKNGHLRGVTVRGNRLIVRLKAPAPDFPARTSMPFFCPLPRSVPINPNGVTNPPGSGPYYFSKADVNRQIVMSRNKYYRGKRPANPNKIEFNLNAGSLETCKLRVDRGSTDWCSDGTPPADFPSVARKCGINKKNGCFFMQKGVFIRYLAMNNSKGATRNAKLRRAVNYVVNRPALVAVTGGRFGGSPFDHILPPSILGSPKGQFYPRHTPNNKDIATAKRICGSACSGRPTLIMFQGNASPRPERAQVIQASLARLGLNVDINLMSRPTQKERTGRRGENFQLTDEGWAADFVDPKSYMDPLLNGQTISETENVNVAYFDEPKYNRAIVNAGRLAGARRFAAYKKLDVSITKGPAPWAVFMNSNDTYYVSKHVGCVQIHPIFELLYGALCLR